LSQNQEQAWTRLFDNLHTRSALEIEPRVRERVKLSRRLEAEYGALTIETRKPVHTGLVTLLNILFRLSI